MERHTVCAVLGASHEGHEGINLDVEARFLPSHLETLQATEFLQHRFPRNCPHHLLHNLLNGHYSQHPLCDARPFHDESCRHGSHARPQLTAAEVSATAPAAGVVIFLPFGLSCTTIDGSRLVSGCADCEFLDEGDACGGCRRVWNGGNAWPARGFTGTEGQNASLATWRESVDLSGSCLPGHEEVDEEESWGEEDWGEEDWREEEDYEEDGDGEEAWAWEDEAEEHHAAAPTDWGGGDDTAEVKAPEWGDGRWASDGYGGWSWTVDFPAALPVPATDASAPVSAEARAAPATTVAADAALRILELELELARRPATDASTPVPASRPYCRGYPS